MTLTPGLRRLVRTGHVIFAVGWLGAVAGFLALALTGLTSEDEQLVRAVHLSMEPIARYVIIPLSFAPLLTGPILSLGTPWGLFRHYWIIVKLAITVLSTLIMQAHIPPIVHLAEAAAGTGVSGAEFDRMRLQMVVAAAAALAALIAATVLAVYKPRGMTRYGWRKQYEDQASHVEGVD